MLADRLERELSLLSSDDSSERERDELEPLRDELEPLEDSSLRLLSELRCKHTNR